MHAAPPGSSGIICTTHPPSPSASYSNQILHPEIPHSLRLQGILVGGVVVVYTKQQVYLLEDVQDMVVRTRSEGLHKQRYNSFLQ